MDGSLKQFIYTPGIDLQTAVPFDAQAFVNQLQSTATINEQAGFVSNVDSAFIQNTFTNLQGQLQDYLNTHVPNATVEDLTGKKAIRARAFSSLAATLPYKTVVTGSRLSEVSNGLRHLLTLEVEQNPFLGPDLTYTASLPELAGKRISLRYSPATDADKQTLLSFGDAAQVSAYLIQMKPELLVEGVVRAVGSSLTMGTEETFRMTFSVPGRSAEQISNVITAGDYTGIGLDLGVVSEAVVQKRVDRLIATESRFAAGDLSAISRDDVYGEALTAQALIYFYELDLLTSMMKAQNRVVATRLPSEGLMTQETRVRTLFGVPVSASAGGMSVDVDRDLQAVLASDGDAAKAQAYVVAHGMLSSGLEHGVFEQLYGREGISAVKALSVANAQGMEIYQVTAANVNAVLPQLALSSTVKADIANAVSAGKVVTVSQSEIQINSWKGVGYIVLDPITGEAGYIISGGLAGGGLTDVIFDLLSWLLSPSDASADHVLDPDPNAVPLRVVDLGWRNAKALTNCPNAVLLLTGALLLSYILYKTGFHLAAVLVAFASMIILFSNFLLACFPPQTSAIQRRIHPQYARLLSNGMHT